MSANTFNARKGINIGSVTADPSSPTNGTIIYRSDLNKFRKYENGAWSDMDTTGGSVPNSYVIVSTPNGYGSGSVVRRWSTVQANVGSDITYADSNSNDGGHFTINTTGVYSISYTDRNISNATSRFGITVNDSNTNHGVGIDSMTYANGYRILTQSGLYGAVNAFSSVSITLRLTAGDVVRAQGGSNNQADSTDAFSTFSITRVS